MAGFGVVIETYHVCALRNLSSCNNASTSDKAGASGNTPRLTKAIIYNNPNGNAPVTDTNKILQQVFKFKSPTQSTATQFTPYLPQSQPESKILEKEITQLEAQLAELRSLSTIGAAGVSKWQSYYTELNDNPQSSSGSQTKQERLETLKQQIAQARSLASIGEARLNKWRSRF